MKNFICTIILMLVCIFFLQNCRITNRDLFVEVSHIETNTLKAYGEEIYKREECINCHTQQINNESSQLISLDGVGGKYSNNWLFNYLLDPKTIIPQAKMPLHRKLFKDTLSKDVLLKIANKKGKKIIIENLWSNLINQSYTISKDLDSWDTTKNNIEVIALISYIQQIPKSRAFVKFDSLERIKYLKKEGVSLITQVASVSANSKKGKLLFSSNCAVCHGQEGQGQIGPNLTDDFWMHGGKTQDIARTILYGGTPGKGMISWKSQLTPNEIGELIAFIASIKGTNPKNAKEAEGELR